MTIKPLLPISSRNSKIYFHVLSVFHWEKRCLVHYILRITFTTTRALFSNPAVVSHSLSLLSLSLSLSLYIYIYIYIYIYYTFCPVYLYIYIFVSLLLYIYILSRKVTALVAGKIQITNVYLTSRPQTMTFK